MQKLFSLFILLGIFAIFNIPMSFAELYENQEFGFEIDFPTGWYVDEYLIIYDAIPGYYDESIDFVGFYDDETWPNHSINIGFVKNYFIAENYEGQEYLDRLETELTEVCQTTTMEFDGYTCSDNKIIESKMITIAGHNAYQVTESWTETYGDQSTFKAIGTSIDIPVGNNVWTIYSLSLDSEYPLVKNQINDSINSFTFTNGGMAPEINFDSSSGDLGDLTSLFQPITANYVNPDVGLAIDFPENWQGIQMKFPKELFENLDTEELANEYPDQFQDQLTELLTSSTIVMAFPADMVTDGNNSGDINMSMLFIVDVSAVENLAETAGQLTSMSSSPDSFYGGTPSESNLDDCDFGSFKVIKVNGMTAYEIAVECLLSETDQNMEMLMYMFGTEEHLIMIMHLNASDSTQLSGFSEFERSLGSLVIDNTVDLSDPQTYSEIFDMKVDTKTIQSNNMSHEVTIVSNTSISDFTFDEQNETMNFMMTEFEDHPSLGYMDVHLDDFLGGPFYATIDGKELEIFVIEDTISDKTILSLEYLLPAEKITIGKQNSNLQTPTTEPIPDWIKSTAGWWANGDVDDASFIQGIKFMIKEKIIMMPETVQGSSLVSEEIPDWIKSTAGWWANGDVDDASFIQGIQFMVENGIISLN